MRQRSTGALCRTNHFDVPSTGACRSDCTLPDYQLLRGGVRNKFKEDVSPRDKSARDTDHDTRAQPPVHNQSIEIPGQPSKWCGHGNESILVSFRTTAGVHRRGPTAKITDLVVRVVLMHVGVEHHARV